MNKQPYKPLFRNTAIRIAPCSFGYGVFAAEDIPADTTLEECHHLRIGSEECLGVVDDYVYGLNGGNGESESEGETYSLPLGCGSIFNHADEPNTGYWHDEERDLIVFHTIKDVCAGEQLFIDYGKDWWETRDLEPE